MLKAGKSHPGGDEWAEYELAALLARSHACERELGVDCNLAEAPGGGLLARLEDEEVWLVFWTEDSDVDDE